MKARILVVDDSAIVRGMWTRLINAEPDLTVAATANNGLKAIDQLKHEKVDLIVLDLEMPGMDGLTAIPRLKEIQPEVPIIIASSLTTSGSRMAIQALSLGACDYVTKPTTLNVAGSLENVSMELLRKIRAITEKPSAQATRLVSTVIQKDKPGVLPKIVMIGTSTGGPAALSVVLRALSPAFTLPVLVVQHMPAYFTTVLAESLGREIGRPCAEAKDGERIKPGQIYIAPGDFHMMVAREGTEEILKLNQEAHEHFCRPAVDPLFRSGAKVYGDALLGVVLTGLGEDGKLGAEEIVRCGGRVIVQDEGTSVVWGMPGAVARAGLASAIVPLGEVGGLIERICAAKGKEGGRNASAERI